MRRYFIIIILLLSPGLKAQQTDYFEWAKQVEILSSALEQLMNNYVEEPSPDKLMSKALEGMLSQTDRFTRFYDEQKMFDQRLRRLGKISGIGAMVKDRKEGLSVRELLPGSPAEQADMRIGDIIIAIDGKKLEDLSHDEKLALLKGKPGTGIKLKLKRGNKEKEITIKREILEQKAVSHYKLLDDGKTGYIKLDRFSQNAASELKEAIVDLKEKGAERLILDLRGNPGGLLNQAVKIVNFFIPQNKTVVTTKGRFSKFNKTYKTKNLPLDEKIPLVVLINKRSASASEIVSGTLQDYDRAVIVGDTSYGKGLVQRFFPLKYGTYIKITISKYYIPSGRQIQKIDYWHRNKEGKVSHYKKDKSRKFYTANRRVVYEHGGITPDIVLRKDSLHPLVKTLVNKDIIFDFDTYYFDSHSSFDPGDKNRIYDAFLQYVQSRIKDLDTESRKKINRLIQTLKKEHAPGKLVAEAEKIRQSLEQSQLKELQSNSRIRKQILQYILSDLLLRYNGKTAQRDFLLSTDKQVKKGMEILSRPSAYQKILKP